MPCPIQIKENITKEINEMSGNYINRSPSYIEKLKTTINNRFKTPVVDFFKQNDDTYLSSINIPQSLIKSLSKIGDVLGLPLNTERLYKLTETYIVSNNKIVNAINKPLPISAKDGLIKTFNSFK